MTRKKKQASVNWKNMCEVQQKEIYQLRKQLDSQADRYNLVQTPIQRQESNRYIDIKEPKPNLIEQPYQINTYLKEFFAKGVALSWLKNHDYGSGDVFGNFREFGTQGFLVRISDKWARIKTFAASGKLLVKDENVLDSLIDLANYCALLGAWLHNQKVINNSNSYTDNAVNEQPR